MHSGTPGASGSGRGCSWRPMEKGRERPSRSGLGPSSLRPLWGDQKQPIGPAPWMSLTLLRSHAMEAPRNGVGSLRPSLRRRGQRVSPSSPRLVVNTLWATIQAGPADVLQYNTMKSAFRCATARAGEMRLPLFHSARKVFRAADANKVAGKPRWSRSLGVARRDGFGGPFASRQL